MNQVKQLNNFLVLTPDGVGSTYLQRALTVYLHSIDLDYWNTHELLNGLQSKKGILYKDLENRNFQTPEKIADLLYNCDNNIISRMALYHVTTRIKRGDIGNYKDLYTACNYKFKRTIFCERDPFEYALSWCIRHRTGRRNVYSIDDRTHVYESSTHNIDLNYFQDKLKEYAEYEYWAKDNFNITHTVQYNDLHENVDAVMQKITGLTHTTFLQEYSRLRYLASKNQYTGENLEKICKMHSMIDRLLFTKRMPTTMPVKMNTMQDKQKSIKNFEVAVDVYNSWATKGNRHEKITSDRLENIVATESKIYADN